MEGELRIQITVGHCLGGVGKDVRPGTIMVAPRDLPIEAARHKLRIGYARLAPEETVMPPPVTPPGRIEVRDPAAESGDPEVAEPERPRARRGKPGGKGRR